MNYYITVSENFLFNFCYSHIDSGWTWLSNPVDRLNFHDSMPSNGVKFDENLVAEQDDNDHVDLSLEMKSKQISLWMIRHSNHLFGPLYLLHRKE